MASGRTVADSNLWMVAWPDLNEQLASHVLNALLQRQARLLKIFPTSIKYESSEVGNLRVLERCYTERSLQVFRLGFVDPDTYTHNQLVPNSSCRYLLLSCATELDCV